MKKIKKLFGILKKIFYSINPKDIKNLSEGKIKKSFQHLFFVIFLCFIVMSIVSIPKLSMLSDNIQGQISNFDNLTIDIEADMNSPVIFTNQSQQIIIDTTKEWNLTKEKLIITKDFIQYRPFKEVKKISTTDLKNLKENKETFSKVLTFLIVLALPSIIIISYIMFTLKYILISLITSLLAYIITRMYVKKIKLKRVLNIAIYSTSLMIFIEIISIPFGTKYLINLFQIMGMNFYLITLLIYFIVFIFSLLIEIKE